MSALLLIVRKSLRQHALSTTITVLSAALASGLVLSVFNVKDRAHEAFEGGSAGYDAVLGARGSQLQLVLNSIFHLETSPGNIPWSLYQEMKGDERVERAVPLAVGDSYRGHRIVGTTVDAFAGIDPAEGRSLRPAAGGRIFDPALREAVVGSLVASRTGLRVGAPFNPSHGIVEEGAEEHEEEYVVVGVLRPTNTPADRVIWIPIDGIFHMEGHVLRGAGKEFVAEEGEEIDDRHKEVSAVLLRFRHPQMGFQFHQEINVRGKEATLAWPLGAVMAELFDKIGWMDRVLAIVAYLVVAVAAGSILASLYNTMNERRREFAVLRALGARRKTVFSVIVLESTAIAALGVLVGLLVYAAIISLAGAVIHREAGVVIDVMPSGESFFTTIVGMVGLGAAAGLLPAWKAYGTDVASNLAPDS